MLPAANRLRLRTDFHRVTTSGRRAGRPALVAQLARPDRPTEAPPRVGFAIGRPVGSAVSRNRLRRRLRHLVRERLGELPTGSLLLVRARPAAAGLDHHELAGELDAVLGRVLR